jgi:pimeloyl-ACP methyl ester carboxylesterase
VNYERRGSGSPLVLIHGIGSRWQVWKPVLDELAARHDVIALDLPGFGGSPVEDVPRPMSGGMLGSVQRTADQVAAIPPGFGASPVDDLPRPMLSGESGSVPRLADRVAAFLAEIGVERPTIGGSSLGGGIALELARRGLARSVVAFAPVGFFTPAGVAWCRMVVGGARVVAAALGPVLPTLFGMRTGRVLLCGIFYGRPGSLPPEDCLADARSLVAAPGFAAARRDLGEWRLATPIPDVPITIAWGDRDLVLPYRQANRARAVLPSAHHVRLPNCGHLPFADDPATCARLLLEAA